MIRYVMAEPCAGVLEVYDATGRIVRRAEIPAQPAGAAATALDGKGLAPGAYLYRLRLSDPETRAERAVLTGKAMLLQ
jgi:hypothetical protein